MRERPSEGIGVRDLGFGLIDGPFSLRKSIYLRPSFFFFLDNISDHLFVLVRVSARGNRYSKAFHFSSFVPLKNYFLLFFIFIILEFYLYFYFQFTYFSISFLFISSYVATLRVFFPFSCYVPSTFCTFFTLYCLCVHFLHILIAFFSCIL